MKWKPHCLQSRGQAHTRSNPVSSTKLIPGTGLWFMLLNFRHSAKIIWEVCYCSGFPFSSWQGTGSSRWRFSALPSSMTETDRQSAWRQEGSIRWSDWSNTFGSCLIRSFSWAQFNIPWVKAFHKSPSEKSIHPHCRAVWSCSAPSQEVLGWVKPVFRNACNTSPISVSETYLNSRSCTG